MVYYIGYYAMKSNLQNRNVYLSATNKMDYIMDCFVDNNIEITVVSLALTRNDRVYLARTTKICDFLFLREFMTIGRKNIFFCVIDRFLLKAQFLFFLLRNVKKKDMVIMYHSTENEELLLIAHKIIKFKLILEVEELYGDVGNDKRLIAKEMRTCRAADAYLVPTNFLNTVVNPDNKPSAVVHGTYQVEEQRDNGIFELEGADTRKHVVYAGTFDPRKGGAIIAAAAAEYLTNDYHIHILGFGNDEEKRYLREEISRVSKMNGALVTMDGLLSGEDYIKFIQSCQIGLSTQNPDAAFNNTSFPSKILSYMANGLRVVSIRIPVIENSAVGDFLYYYDVQSPKCVAEAIQSVDMSDSYEGREIIANLDVKFQKDLMRLLDEVVLQ